MYNSQVRSVDKTWLFFRAIIRVINFSSLSVSCMATNLKIIWNLKPTKSLG